MKSGKAIVFYLLMIIIALLVIFAIGATILAGGIDFSVFKNNSKTTDSGSGTVTTEKPVITTKSDGKTTDKTVTTEPAVTTAPKPKDVYTEVPEIGTGSMSIMSFDCSSDSFKADEIAGFLDNYSPAVWCSSNLTEEKLTALISSAPKYSAIGLASEKTSGLYNVIFYNPEIVGVQKSATIWLSGTPAAVSKHASAETYDTCTYALFTEKASGQYFAVFCTNLDSNKDARTRQLVYLYTKYQCYIDYFPTVVTGHLNLSGDEENYTTLLKGGRLNDVEPELGARNDCMLSCCFNTDYAGEVSYTANKTTGKFYKLSYTATPYTMDFSKPRVALTFDDGPSGNTSSIQYTSAVIDALKAYKAKGTFFVLGRCIEKCGQTGLDLVGQEHSLGYEIGNHTWDHESWGKLSNDKLMEVLGKTDAKIQEATGGMSSTVLRAPGGGIPKEYRTTAPIDQPVIYWTIDTKDWDRASGVTPDDVLSKIKSNLKHGRIVLEHDIQYNTVKIVDKIVAWIDSQGYQMVTVSELFEFEGIQIDSGHLYFDTENTPYNRSNGERSWD